MIKASDNIFSDFGYSVEEADNLKYRSDLMISIKKKIIEYGWPQAQAAKILHVTQPRVSDLMRGKIHLFTVDTLLEMLKYVGLKAEIKVDSRPVEKLLYWSTISSAANLSTDVHFPTELNINIVETLSSAARRTYQNNLVFCSEAPAGPHLSAHKLSVSNVLAPYRQGYMHTQLLNSGTTATKVGLYALKASKTLSVKEICV